MIDNKEMTFIKKEWSEGLLFFVAAFFLLFWGLGVHSLWGSEGCWAEIAREMLISGDFFHPIIGGKPYFDKPLVTYWVMEWDPPVTLLTDETAVRIFLDNNKPGVIISQNRYITETVASMLPTQPAYAETCYKWESPERKYRVWLINQDNIQTETKT